MQVHTTQWQSLLPLPRVSRSTFTLLDFILQGRDRQGGPLCRQEGHCPLSASAPMSCLPCAEPCPQFQLAVKGLELLVALGRQIPLNPQGYRGHQGQPLPGSPQLGCPFPHLGAS